MTSYTFAIMELFLTYSFTGLFNISIVITHAKGVLCPNHATPPKNFSPLDSPAMAVVPLHCMWYNGQAIGKDILLKDKRTCQNFGCMRRLRRRAINQKLLCSLSTSCGQARRWRCAWVG